MNEAETRAELIDPKLKACGWGVIEGSRILRERLAKITDGKIQVGGGRSKPLEPTIPTPINTLVSLYTFTPLRKALTMASLPRLR